jgi:hypothetical protein
MAATVLRNGDEPLILLQPGRSGPAAATFAHDFPHVVLPAGEGHDGQQFYAIARQPMHPRSAASSLGGNPRYRLQRIAFPFLAWALHPSGGGYGLVWAMLIVSALAVLVGGLATGALSVTLGGPAWAAAAFCALPGVIAAARLTTADNLAMALSVVALTLSLRSRSYWAILAGVFAVLTREVSLVPLVGLALWRRDLEGGLLVVIPAIAGASWFLALRAMFPGVVYGSDRSQLLHGLRIAVPYWWHSDHGALGVAVLALLVGASALVVRSHSPLWLAILFASLVPFFLADEALDSFWNLSRILLPPMLLSVIALLAGASPMSSTALHRDP